MARDPTIGTRAIQAIKPVKLGSAVRRAKFGGSMLSPFRPREIRQMNSLYIPPAQDFRTSIVDPGGGGPGFEPGPPIENPPLVIPPLPAETTPTTPTEPAPPATTPPTGGATTPPPAPTAPAGDPNIVTDPSGRKWYRWNPQLPEHPLGAFADETYLGEVAGIKFNTIADYQDILRKIGYVDDQGNFIRGSLEIAAEIENQKNQKLLEEAGIQATNEMRNAATLWSSYRPIYQEQQQRPYTEALQTTKTNLGTNLQDAISEAAGVLRDYGIDINDAVGRATVRAILTAKENPVGEPEASAPAAKPAVKPKPVIPGKVKVGKKGTPMNAKQLRAHLKKTGGSVAKWIRQHPAAAKRIGLTVKPPKPKKGKK